MDKRYLMWESAEVINIKFCWLMHPLGGWVFVMDVTKWKRRKFYISSAHSKPNEGKRKKESS